jgi:hypothetical protein
MNNQENLFLQYMEYLNSIGCTLDENGNIVPINNNDGPRLVLVNTDDEDE